jgi:hypothetical protein
MRFRQTLPVVLVGTLMFSLRPRGTCAHTPQPSPQPTPSLWSTLHCDDLFATLRARKSMTPDQLSKVRPLGGSWNNETNLIHHCVGIIPQRTTVGPTTFPSPHHQGSVEQLSPNPAPPTPSSTSSPSSAADRPFGPSSSFAGAEVSACTTVPNQTPQPPDVVGLAGRDPGAIVLCRASAFSFAGLNQLWACPMDGPNSAMAVSEAAHEQLRACAC